jgi:hypothetical protein
VLFVPLTQVWGRDGAASVALAALEDAGFHPVIECDSRGWMHFYGWPFGSSSPITIWIPDLEHDDAMAYLDAGSQPSPGPDVYPASLAELVWGYRRWVYVAWLFDMVGLFAVILGMEALFRALTGGVASELSDESSGHT